ncbi:MAG: N-6 DNA methylase [Leptospiraceae bacterium]|nr:N-6 DNA methylase [Leptospiraceae bacterium]
MQSTAPDKMTGEQKALLRKYEGWGGQTRNDKSNYDGKGLLYEFYTPENVVKKSWEIIDRYLKPGSEILEPCAGTGRFAEGKSSYKFDLIELDETSSKIAGILNPGATVTTGQFETLFLDDRNRSKKQYDGKLYDAVVTNPPYGTMGGKYKATEGRGWQRYEEYFIHRSLDTVKEGGIVAMVVPSAFLRKGMTKSKEKIFAKAELLEAHRLPNGAFANTQIGTDLVILRKNTTPDKDVSNAAEDRYFKNNPDHLHGTEIDTLDRFGKPDKQVKGRIDQFLNHQPGKAKALSDTHKKAIADGLLGNKIAAGKHRKAATNRKVTRTRTVSNATRKTKNSSTRNIQPPKILSQQEFNQKYGLSFSEKEIQMMRSSNALGYVDHEIPFDGSIMSYHSGGHLPDYLYATGNIYERLEQLEQDREEILEKYGLEQFQKQHNMLRDAVPPHVKAQDIIFDPIDPFCQGMTFADSEGEDDTMVSRFKDWVRSLDYEMFRGYNATRGDVSAYCDGRPVTGNDKRRNEAIRRERKMLSQKLMEKYVKDFLPESERKQIEDAWNRKFNAYVEVDPARVPLPIEGLNSKFKGKDYDLRDVQHHFAATFLTKGVGCAAHEVGLGKTMTGIISTASNMQIGRCKRPLFTVPSSTLSEWEASAKSLYPNMSINVIGTNELNRMTAGGKKLEIPEGSMTIMSYDAFARLGFTEERFEELTKELQDAHGNPYEKEGPTVTVDGLTVKVQIDNSLVSGKADKRKAAKAKEKAEALASKALKGTQKNLLFDEIGFDHLTVDEAHNFNNIFGDVKGTDESGKKTRVANEYQGILGAGNVSDRGMKLFVAAQHILKTNENRNVLLLTATPFTNNPLQVYSLLSVMAKERLNEMGIRNVKDFVSMFVETQREITMEANGNVKERQTVRRFKNGHAFANLINEFFDRKTGEQANIQRPDLVEKEIVLPATDEMNRMRQSLEEYYDKAFAPDAKERDPSAAIKSMTLQQNLNVSPGLVKDFEFNASGSSGFVERSPKLKFVAKSAVEYYKRMQSAQGTPPGQIFFMPRGVDYFNQIKEYMVKQGIPEEAIQIMTPAEKNKKARNPANKAQGMSRFDEIKFDFNDPNGKTKIVIGSDAIQEGVNLQENTGVMYNCLLSWNPTNNEQKKGRGWRQGNQQKTTHMFYPVIENSIDTKLFQKHAEKVSRINDIFKTTGSPFIETAEINPDELKFEIITDPVKRARLVAAETEKQKFAAIQDRITDKNMLQSILNRSETLDDRVDAAQKQVDKYAEWSSEGSDYWKEALSKEKALLARLKRDRSNLDSMLQEKGYSAESLSKRIGEMDREIAVMQDDATKKKEDLEKELTERFTREQEEAAKSRPKESLDEMVESHVSKLVASSLGHQVYKSNLWDLVFRGRKGAANAKRYQAATA